MSKTKITEVMMDDKTIDASKEIAMVFSIANTLRGPYKPDKYKDVIIPMIILRRLECALAPKKKAVVDAFKKNPAAPAQVLCKKSDYPFYNTCEFDLKKLLTEAPAIVENLTFYIESFSPNVQAIFEELKFKEEIKNLDKNNRLLGVVKKFSELDLDPERVDGLKMGYMFEEIIRRFSENAEAGDHYTPREVIRLLTSILLAEGCSDIFREGREITVLDMACGTGGMLSTAHDFIIRMNPDAKVRLFGQENNDESHAICLADMLIKNQAAENIRFADTMKEDCFEGTPMRFVIANPPFGQPWGGKDAGDGVEAAVRKEHKKGKEGRFPAGLPATGDMQLLFMQHAVAKMQKGVGRAAIITNGSPLFSGNTTSGESQIRRYLLENDLVEAIIALPSQLFYNTDIAIYAFILSKGKRNERKGKVQFINATDMWTPLKRSLGKKRREIAKTQITLITEMYADFAQAKKTQWCEKRKHECIIESKIFDREEFLYKEWSVYQPLQRRGVISAASIEALRTSAYFTANTNIFNEAKFEELEQTNPRSDADEKAYQKQLRGRVFTETVIKALKTHESDTEYDDFSKFEAALNKILVDIDGLSASRLTGVAMEMSVMDKTAVVQKDRKGNVILDPTTKDTEIVRLNQDVALYMKTEVFPHIPDAIYRYEFDDKKAESASNKERLGAEFPFARYFYEYHELEKADSLLSQFFEQNATLAEKIATLQKVGDSTETMKASGIQWVGEIPESWDQIRTKHFSYMKGRIGWQGLTSDEFIEEGPFLVTGTDFENGRVCWDRSYHISNKRYEEAPEIQLQIGDLLVTKDGTIGKLAYIDELPDQASLNSHLLVMRPLKGKYINRFLYWMLSSSVFVEYYGLVSDGSTMNSLSQEKMGNFTFPTPPIDEQEDIANYLDKQCGELDSIISDLEAQLETMKEYKKALIMECVTGKKRVKED